MVIRITTKSYPYLAIAQDWDIPYWVILCLDDPREAWREMAMEWLVDNVSYTEREDLFLLLDEVRATVARGQS